MDIDNILNTNRNKYKPTDTNSSKPIVTTKKYDCDYLYEQLGDLVNDKWKPWFIKQFYKLGKDRVLQLASIARADGKQPDRLFAKLIKDNS